ncbi:MAG: helix-turn-helix domain-containing protein [Chloroflexi bacterium]|nr:helix-turn-helix domain-containing protein [Chloroflexota bacterium]
MLESSRKRLGLTQAKLAELLDVPVNTVSRWETGATTPDANALAAIYSIAKQQDVTPQFFQRRATVQTAERQRTKLILAWDYQNRGLDASEVASEWSYMWKYIDLLHPGTKASRQLWAYTSPYQWNAADELKKLRFQVYDGAFDADSQLVQDVRAECQKKPNKTVFVLAADDGNYVELLRGLKEIGVDVYVWGTDQCNERLVKAVDPGHFIHWDGPFVVTECVDVVRGLNGRQITRAEFGSLCKSRLDEEGAYPYEVGFSAKNPYSSVLRWLDRQGIVEITEVTGKSDTVSIRLGKTVTGRR